MLRPPPTSTLFPSPTPFRSHRRPLGAVHDFLDTPRAPVDLPAIAGHPPPIPILKLAREVVEDVPILRAGRRVTSYCRQIEDRKSTRLNSSHSQISYAVFCLK